MDVDALLALVERAMPGEGLSTDDLLGVCWDTDGTGLKWRCNATQGWFTM